MYVYVSAYIIPKPDLVVTEGVSDANTRSWRYDMLSNRQPDRILIQPFTDCGSYSYFHSPLMIHAHVLSELLAAASNSQHIWNLCICYLALNQVILVIQHFILLFKHTSLSEVKYSSVIP